MKATALILLFAMTVFLTETIVVVPVMRSVPVVCSSEITAAEECCEKSDGEKAENGDCNDNACCRSCPVCYVFISQPLYEWQAKWCKPKRNYADMNEADSCSFTAFIWKPPNAGLYFY